MAAVADVRARESGPAWPNEDRADSKAAIATIDAIPPRTEGLVMESTYKFQIKVLSVAVRLEF